ncbi:HAD family hydrolase [Roseivivax sp. CAU 1761]
MTAPPGRRDIAAVLFDKDGTLFDFTATWAAWTAALLDDLAGGDPGRAARLAARIGFDPETRRFAPGSPVVAGTPADAATCLAPELPGWDVPALTRHLARRGAAATPVPPVPLAPLLDRLRGAGLVLGVVTNDSAEAAAAHLRQSGVADRFAFVAGFDSGHGCKPDPAPLLAFARAVGIAAPRVLMVGDSLHDLHAARAAGMAAVAVRTGPAEAGPLARHAAALLPDIGALPGWLGLDAA